MPFIQCRGVDFVRGERELLEVNVVRIVFEQPVYQVRRVHALNTDRS